MDQSVGVQTLIARGNEALRDGELAQAGEFYSRAVQTDASDPEGHLGLAEVYFAQNQHGAAYMAARQVQQLAPESAPALVAGTILAALDSHFDVALAQLQRAIDLDPARPYAHALRGYCLRRLGQNYDASLAEARAARLWGRRDLAHLFPEITPAPPPPAVQTRARTAGTSNTPRPWSERSQFERRMVRVRFLTRGVPIATYSLIVINVVIFLLSYFDPNQTLYNYGIEQGALIAHNPAQVYRIFTAMFLHAGWAHIGLNMLSLYFIGVITERFFGTRKFLVIYFASGILAGAAQAVLTPSALTLGASGAIFGVFGALGAVALLQRRSGAPGGSSLLTQWVFFLVINLVFDLSATGIALYAHIGGLIVGILIGLYYLRATPRSRTRMF